MYCNQCGAVVTEGAQFCDSCGNRFPGALSSEKEHVPAGGGTPATTETADQWHYILNGKRMGPITLQRLQDLAAEGKISRETAILDSQGDWKVASDVVSFPPQHYMRGEVSNLYAWLIVSVPIIGAGVEHMINRQLAWVYLTLNIILCFVDGWKLENARRPAPSSWWCLLIPVYLWQRATLLKQKRVYFWAWMAVFVFSIGVQFIAEHGAVEQSACNVVTEIIAKHVKGGPTCKAVSLTETVADEFYRGKAILSNGNEINVAVEKLKDGKIYVNIID